VFGVVWYGQSYGGGVLQLSEAVVAQSVALFGASDGLGRYLQSNADALQVDGLLEVRPALS
jgi:hypothetical protein